MAETSTFRFSTFSSIPISKESTVSSSSTSFPPRRLYRPQSRSFSFTVKSSSGSGNFLGDDAFGFYPWENNHSVPSSIEWVSEDKVTLFTADGLMQIGGNLVPRRVSSADVCAFLDLRSL
ncbi:hypothetical protein ACJIZ3_021897 [Penstemon smallii]|uniref:Uncharacterized protein n=1 Tax=Penstemon smallii TaxID=265156 RepID=A0ABD3SNQ6_9LAMI